MLRFVSSIKQSSLIARYENQSTVSPNLVFLQREFQSQSKRGNHQAHQIKLSRFGRAVTPLFLLFVERPQLSQEEKAEILWLRMRRAPRAVRRVDEKSRLRVDSRVEDVRNDASLPCGHCFSLRANPLSRT